MNLIEQLGGYGETKKHLDSCWCDDDNKTYLLEKLLEYRRQHDIFEAGDKVVFINDVYADYDNVVSIEFIGKFDLMVSDHTKGFQLNEFCAWSKIIRHATDEEIKAGRRL